MCPGAVRGPQEVRGQPQPTARAIIPGTRNYPLGKPLKLFEILRSKKYLGVSE